METINHYEKIRLALDVLRSELDPYVEAKMRDAYGDGYKSHYALPEWSDGETKPDISVLANTIVNNWEPAFKAHMPREAKHLVHQVRKTRNRFAHQESFDLSDTYSALHEAQRLLEAIGADADPLVRSKRELVDVMALEGGSAEDLAKQAEAEADAALAEGADARAPGARIVLVSNGQPTTTHFPVSGSAVIGRASGDVDIDLAECADGAYVSRRHARISLEDGAYVLEDLGSSNGTYVRRDDFERIERVEIADGDEIAFGNAKFVFRLEG